MRRRAAGLSASEPVRIGYVKWCPTDWAERAAGVAQLRVDTWVMPSHTQAARVADGSLDLAICWVQTPDLESLSLERASGRRGSALRRLCVGSDTSPVRGEGHGGARWTPMSRRWSSWNRYGEQFAADTGARTLRIDDGGCHRADVLRARAQAAPSGPEQPQGAGQPSYPAIWSGVRWWRRRRCGRGHWCGDAVRQCHGAGRDRGVHRRRRRPAVDDESPWLPAGDPHRAGPSEDRSSAAATAAATTPAGRRSALLEAVAQQWRHRDRPDDLSGGVAGRQQGDRAGNCSSRPAASAIVLTPMNVPPNRTAPTRRPPRRWRVRAGRSRPPARQRGHSSRGCDYRALSHAHSAADGVAARPTTSHAPLPSQPGECCATAATRNVPAMM